MFGEAQKKQILRNSLLLENISTKSERGKKTQKNKRTKNQTTDPSYWSI